jgi:hypothetical protein
MVVLVYMTAEAPAVRDFLVTAWDPSTGATMACSADAAMADVSCRVAPTYHVVEYAVTNCLDAADTLPPQTLPTSVISYVTHYYEAVARQSPDAALAALTLCGETWLSLYRRARLELYCDADQVLFIAVKPWYRAALYATAAWLSGRRDEPVWRALQQLEQYCEARDMVLDLFVNVSAELEPLDDATEALDWQVLCDWAQQSNESQVTHNVTLPFYFYHHSDWYFAAFRSIIYYNDAKMPVKASLIVSLVSVCAFGLLVALTLTVRHVWLSARLRNADTEEYLLV